MALRIEALRTSRPSPNTFPILGFTPKERVFLNGHYTQAQETRTQDGLTRVQDLFVDSYGKSTGLDLEQRDAMRCRVQRLSRLTGVSLYKGLDHLVQEVTTVKIAVDFWPGGKSELSRHRQTAERFSGAVRSMETALNSLTLLLQLQLGYPSRQALKREAKKQVQVQLENTPKPANCARYRKRYFAKLSQVQKHNHEFMSNEAKESIDLYAEWKSAIQNRSQDLHKVHVRVRGQVEKLKKAQEKVMKAK